MSVWRMAALGAGLAAYALLSNWLMVHAAAQAWTVALLFGPLLLGIAAMGWHKRQVLTLAACAALLALLVAVVWRGGVADAQLLYVLQHAGLHFTLAWAFGITLWGDEKPFITTLAEGVHARLGQSFSPELAQYTRGVTWLWTAYFLATPALSALIYILMSWPAWTLYCTVLTPLAAAALFVGEHLWRLWRHPEFPRVTLRAALDAYQRSGRAQPQSKP